MTVESLLSRISSAELTYWMAYYALEPFGESWLQTGIIASTVANANMAGGEPLKPSDFMPVAPEVTEETSEADVKRRIVSRMMQEQLRRN